MAEDVNVEATEVKESNKKVLTKEKREAQKKERIEQLKKKKVAMQEILRKKEQQKREMDLKIKALEAGLPPPLGAKRKLEIASGMILFRFIQTQAKWFGKIVNHGNLFTNYASERPDVIKYLQNLSKSISEKEAQKNKGKEQ